MGRNEPVSLIPFRKSTSPDRIDADLLRYSVDGDAEAFRRLVEKHLPTVQQAAARVLGHGSAWQDDVAQDVFLQLARKAPRLPADTVVCAWLHRQAVRRAIDIIRSEDRRHREAQADIQPRDDSDGDDSPWSTIAPRLDGELLRLPRQDQEVLALRFMERCSSDEAARRLGLTSAVVRKRIERALGKLRRRLAGPVPGALTVTAITGHCLATPAAPFLLSFSTLAIMTKTQALCTAGAVVTLGAGILVAYRTTPPASPLPATQPPPIHPPPVEMPVQVPIAPHPDGKS